MNTIESEWDTKNNDRPKTCSIDGPSLRVYRAEHADNYISLESESTYLCQIHGTIHNVICFGFDGNTDTFCVRCIKDIISERSPRIYRT